MSNTSTGSRRVVVAVFAAAMVLAASCASAPRGAAASRAAPPLEEGSTEQLFPELLTARAAWTGEPRATKLRVWVDEEYRTHNPRWKDDLDDVVAYANRVLIPMLGVGLAAEYLPWEHRPRAGDLTAELAALIQTDPGDDVMWVVGVIAGTADSSTSFEQHGAVQSSHLIVRAGAENEQALERAYPEASADERAAALVARRRHSTTVALLHQLAHSLGAVHEVAPDQLLSTSYSPATAATIGEQNRTRMLRAFEDRQAAASQYREAERLLAGGQAAAAAAALAPVQRWYPARVRLRVLRCRIALAQGTAQAAETDAMCDDAAATGFEGAIAVAAARRAAGDVGGAQRILLRAEEHLPGIAPDKTAAAWITIAGAYRDIGAVTRAENALARAGAGAADHGIATWAATTRARYGIPRDGDRWNLTPDSEAEAVAVVRKALALVNASDWEAAAKTIDEAERRWPALPGMLTARCALEFRRDAIAAARRLCARALAQGGSSWALYLLGTMELETRRGPLAAGIAHLREAIARDPDLVQAWRKLARVLEKTRATAELEQVRRDYQARFGAALVD